MNLKKKAAIQATPQIIEFDPIDGPEVKVSEDTKAKIRQSDRMRYQNRLIPEKAEGD